jgi:hypothetical protein
VRILIWKLRRKILRPNLHLQLQIIRDETEDIGLSGIKSRVERQKDRLQAFRNVAEKRKQHLKKSRWGGGEVRGNYHMEITLEKIKIGEGGET